MKHGSYVCDIHDKSGSLYQLYKFIPSWRHLMPDHDLFRREMKNKASIIFRFVFGYIVFILYSTNDKPVGFCVLKRRQGFRQTFMKKGDVLIAPYYVAEESRGKGLAVAMMKTIISQGISTSSGSCYAVVHYDNYASLHVLEQVGFVNEGYLIKKFGFIQSLTIDIVTRLYVLKFE